MPATWTRFPGRPQFVRHPFLAILAGSGGEAFEDALDRTGLDMAQLSESSKGELALSRPGQCPLCGPGFRAFAGKRTGTVAQAASCAWNLKGYKDGREAASASRMILATDIRTACQTQCVSGGYECFAYSLKDGQPLANAKIGILGANGKLVAEKIPTAAAMFLFASRLVAGKQAGGCNGQKWQILSWLPLRDRSRELNFSEFPVGAPILPGWPEFLCLQRARPFAGLAKPCALAALQGGPILS